MSELVRSSAITSALGPNVAGSVVVRLDGGEQLLDDELRLLGAGVLEAEHLELRGRFGRRRRAAEDFLGLGDGGRARR